MPDATPVQRRDKALFALWVMTAARASALASLRTKHVNMIDDVIFQDGREVKTKGAKSFDTWFFPVNPMYREGFAIWFEELMQSMHFGPSDALFPKQRIVCLDGRFTPSGFETEPFATSQIVRKVIATAFTNAGFQAYVPHSIRKTIAMLGNQVCKDDWKSTKHGRRTWGMSISPPPSAPTCRWGRSGRRRLFGVWRIAARLQPPQAEIVRFQMIEVTVRTY